MPKVSLVICLHGERDFFERLLEHAEGCYDDLVIIHDGPERRHHAESVEGAGGNAEPDWKSPEELSLSTPGIPPAAIARDHANQESVDFLPPGYRLVNGPAEPGGIYELVAAHGGRFYEGARCFQQEPHLPFAWAAAKHNWILRLDADEFPSEDLKRWIKCFRQEKEPVESLSGYTCIWPLWNGREAIANTWPSGRLFLFQRNRVRFFGLAEQILVADGYFENTDLILHHQPRRKSYGIRNILFRRQAYCWRKVIATSLLQNPLSLPRWRHVSPAWPAGWQAMVDEPLVEGFYRLWKFPLEQARALRAHNLAISPSICLNPAIHHFLICMQLWKLRGFPRPRVSLRRIVKKIILGTIFSAISSRRKGLQTLGGICPWTLDASMIHKTFKVISGGVGGDISFELELSGRTGCEIALFDPSPTGKATIQSLSPLPMEITYHPIGLAEKSGSQRFAQPFNLEEGSFRQPCRDEEKSLEWDTISVPDFMRDQAWEGLDMIKLDIEGFEFEVLDSILNAKIACKQLLVEFHYGKAFKNSFWRYVATILRLAFSGYRLVHLVQSDHTFIHKSNI